MQTQLQDRIDLMTRLLLQLHQVVDVIRIEHQRLLAYHIASQTQSVTDERIVGVGGRTDRHPVEWIVGTHLLGAETVKLFVFGIESAVGKTAVETTYRVESIVCNHQIIAGIGDRLDMTRRYVAGGSDECELFFIRHVF